MRPQRALSIALALPVCLSFALACEKDKPAPAPAAQPSAAPVASAAPPASASASAASGDTDASASAASDDARPGALRGGPAAMLFRGARALDLKDAQKDAIDKAEQKAKPDPDHPRTELKALHDDLAASVKAGKIDPAKLDARFAAVQKAIQAQQDKQAEALNALWAALEPLQRKIVVSDIRTKRAERDDLERRERDAGAFDPAERDKRRLARLTQDLDLDDAQQQKVAAYFAKAPPPADVRDLRADMKKRIDALLAAFDGAAFDAKKLEPFGGQSGTKARAPLEAEVKFLSDLVPVLRPEQRDKLAAKLDAAGARPNGGIGSIGGHDGPDAPHVWPFPFEPGRGDKVPGNAQLGAKAPPKR